MRVRWTVPAAQDLEQIKQYLDVVYPHLSESAVRAIYRRIPALKSFPRRGREGRLAGTRELRLPPLPYVVVYRLHEQAIEILHIHHGSQDWK